MDGQDGAGEWPLPLMLDETWLRAHRSLVRALGATGLWPEPTWQRQFVIGERRTGTELRDALLPEAVGQDDLTQLVAESAFGLAGARLQRRLPFVLAFGYRLGRGFHEVLDADAVKGDEVGRLGALFNLGISVFDLLTDTRPQDFGQLLEVFDDDALDRAATDRDGAAALSKLAADVDDVEVRIALKLIGAVFERIHAITPPGNRDGLGAVQAALGSAYRAQLASAWAAERDQSEWLDIAQAKSTLPFTIIGLFARLPARRDGTRGQTLDDLVNHVGRAFWLVDDLADVVSDVQSGGLNLLLVRSGARAPTRMRLADDYETVATLLESELIEHTAQDATDSLREAMRMVTPGVRGGGEGRILEDLLVGYPRDWLES